MKKLFSLNTKKVIVSALIIFFIAFPTIIVAVQPQSYNALTQVLFAILLLVASLWIGKVSSEEEVKKNATAKWLPAAEMVCNELLTMSATTERLCRKQTNICEPLRATFPHVSPKTLSPIEQFIDMRCGYCSEGLENLKNHIENSYSNWDLFISNNCEELDCQDIHKRLDERRTVLFAAVERDFPQGPS